MERMAKNAARCLHVSAYIKGDLGRGIYNLIATSDYRHSKRTYTVDYSIQPAFLPLLSSSIFFMWMFFVEFA